MTHHRRPVAKGKDVAAMSLVKMGSGCNLLGYYMYHGGTNPDGKLSTLQESRATNYANDLPVKSYDFNASVKEFGQLSDSFREIRLLASFIHDFGEDFCSMVPHLPADNPLYPTNQTDLRYTVRHNGKSGYLFVNNYQRRREMAAHDHVSLKVELDSETITIPSFDVKNGDFFFLPVNMPLGENAVLKSALATPLCRLGEDTWVFYGDCDPQFTVESAGNAPDVTLLHLTRADALKASKITLDRDYLVISDADMIPMDDGIHFQSLDSELRFRTWPPLSKAPEGFAVSEENGYGVYTRDMAASVSSVCDAVVVETLAESDDITELYVSSRTAGFGGGEDVSSSADKPSLHDPIAPADIPAGYSHDGAIYRLTIPGAAEAKTADSIIDAFLTLDFSGDRFEVYQNGKLISDYFYTGQQIQIGLKRFDYPIELVIKVFAYHDADPVYLEAIPKTENGAVSSIDQAKLMPQWDVVI